MSLSKRCDSVFRLIRLGGARVRLSLVVFVFALCGKLFPSFPPGCHAIPVKTSDSVFSVPETKSFPKSPNDKGPNEFGKSPLSISAGTSIHERENPVPENPPSPRFSYSEEADPDWKRIHGKVSERDDASNIVFFPVVNFSTDEKGWFNGIIQQISDFMSKLPDFFQGGRKRLRTGVRLGFLEERLGRFLSTDHRLPGRHSDSGPETSHQQDDEELQSTTHLSSRNLSEKETSQTKRLTSGKADVHLKQAMDVRGETTNLSAPHSATNAPVLYGENDKRNEARFRYVQANDCSRRKHDTTAFNTNETFISHNVPNEISEESTLADRSGNLGEGESEKVLQLALEVYQIAKKHKVTSLVAAPCQNTISWLPETLKRLEMQTSRIQFYCIDVDGSETEMLKLKRAFKGLNSVRLGGFITVQAEEIAAAMPRNLDMVVSGFGVNRWGARKAMRFEKALRQSGARMALFAGAPSDGCEEEIGMASKLASSPFCNRLYGTGGTTASSTRTEEEIHVVMF